MINSRFGALTVTRKLGPDPKWRMSQWECQCDCGATVIRTGRALRDRKYPSCGCIHPVTTRNTYRKYGDVESCLANTAPNGECMEWAGHKSRGGYAMLGAYKGKFTEALPSAGHRRVFLLHYGFLPPVVMHTCDNPPCINPKHLRAGTKKENSQDSVQKGRFNQSKRKYKVLLKGEKVTLAEYAAAMGTSMSTLQWQARHGKLVLLSKEDW